MIDSVFTLIQYGLLGLVGFLVLGWLGFRIPARSKKPELAASTSDMVVLPFQDDLPIPFANYLKILYPAEIPSLPSLTAWGNGKISSRLRVLGQVWLPLSWTLFLNPGRSYLWRVNISWFTRPFLRGGDLFLDGHGIYKMGSDILESEFIDLSEFTLLWIYTLVFAPFSLAGIPDLVWKSIDEHTVRLTVPGLPKAWNDFQLHFNSTSGLLESIKTKRAASRDGELLDFQVALTHDPNPKFQSFQPILTNSWEAVPYLSLTSSGIAQGTEIDRELENGI